MNVYYRRNSRPIYVHRHVHLIDVVALSTIAAFVGFLKLAWWLLVGVYLIYKWAAIWIYRAACEIHRRYVTRSRGQVLG